MNTEIDIAELVRRRSAGGLALIDVRAPHEYEEGHVPGAVLVPLDELADRLDDVPDGVVHVICRSGGRSAMACATLRAAGREAINIAGGTLAWIDAGHEVAIGSAEA